MGTTATVRACGPDRPQLQAAVAAALDEIDRLDALLSHYKPDSPVSRLNRTASAGPVVVDPELFALLDRCLAFSRESEGAFDVTVGPLMRAWGFFRDEGRVPSATELERARAAVGFEHVRLDPKERAVGFARPGMEIDLGGIGKGYAVDRTVAVLRARGVGSALVNLGGSSVYGLGTPPGQDAWPFSVEDPLRAGRISLRVRLRDRALSVSGARGRFFEENGVLYGHVLDPRNGRPVQGIAGTAVLSADATTGDALDNALFVLGPVAGRALAARHGVEAWVFEPHGRTSRVVGVR
jgi:thiamine biosynthesis lipoprotein